MPSVISLPVSPLDDRSWTLRLVPPLNCVHTSQRLLPCYQQLLDLHQFDGRFSPICQDPGTRARGPR